jgi:hypothetical protein
MIRFADIASVSSLLRFIDENRPEILYSHPAPSTVPGVARLRDAVQVEDDFIFIRLSVFRRGRISGVTAHPAVMYFRRPERVRLAGWSLDMEALDAVGKAGVTGDFARAAAVLGAEGSDELLAIWDTGIPAGYLIDALQLGFRRGDVATVVEAWRGGVPVEYLGPFADAV